MYRFKELRKEKNLNQLDVAKYLGVSIQTYSNYELGNTEPDIKNLIALAKFYNVSIDYLVGATDKRNNTHIIDLIENVKPDMYEMIVKLLENLQNDKN